MYPLLLSRYLSLFTHIYPKGLLSSQRFSVTLYFRQRSAAKEGKKQNKTKRTFFPALGLGASLREIIVASNRNTNSTHTYTQIYSNQKEHSHLPLQTQTHSHF